MNVKALNRLLFGPQKEDLIGKSPVELAVHYALMQDQAIFVIGLFASVLCVGGGIWGIFWHGDVIRYVLPFVALLVSFFALVSTRVAIVMPVNQMLQNQETIRETARLSAATERLFEELVRQCAAPVSAAPDKEPLEAARLPSEPAVNVIDADVPDDDDDGNWVSIFDKAWPRMFLLDHLVTALGETGHWIRDFTAAVMAAAFCEYYLYALIRTREPGPSDSDYLTFTARIRHARSLNVLPERLDQPLKALAKVRNSFAHDIEYRLSEEEMEALETTLDDAMRDEIAKLQAEGVTKSKGTPLELRFRVFVGTLVDELEKTLRSHETIEDSFR